MITPIKQRLHITFGKLGPLKFIGHLDMAKTWERVLRRADLPILYTRGFNTRPRIQLATAVPLGVTSECEIVDVALRETISTLAGVAERLEAVSPHGLRVYRVEDTPIDGPPLQTLVTSAEYRITPLDAVDEDALRERVAALLAAERIIKVKQSKRRKSSFDMRPLVHALSFDEVQPGSLVAHVAVGERGSLRIDDLLAELGLKDVHVSVHRFRLHLDDYYARLRANRNEP